MTPTAPPIDEIMEEELTTTAENTNSPSTSASMNYLWKSAELD